MHNPLCLIRKIDIMKIILITYLILFLSCSGNTSKQIGTEPTKDSEISKLKFKAENGIDEFYNSFGLITLNFNETTTTTSIEIFKNESCNTRFSLPINWQIEESENIVQATINDCNDCYYVVFKNNIKDINMTLTEYLEEVKYQLHNDTTEIAKDLQITTYEQNETKSYLVEGLLTTENKVSHFKNFIVDYEGSIYDIVLKQTKNVNLIENEILFHIVSASLNVEGENMFSKEIEKDFSIGYESK